MDQNLEKRNETAVSKCNVAAFVHDMKELEIKQFTLRKLHEKCVEERNRTKKNSENEFNTAENADRKAIQELNEALQNRKIKPQEIIEKPKEAEAAEPLGKGLMIFLGLIWGFYLICLLTKVIDFILPFFCYSLILVLYLLEFIRRNKKNKQYLNYLQKNETYEKYQSALSEYEQQEQHLYTCQNQYALAQKEFIHAKKQRKEAQKQIEKLDCITKLLAQHIDEIESKKDQLYALNIVPPDYRTLDSLIEFDQMYRNDLVDTMREAVLIYEERVARKVLIRGIEKIYTMLGNLTSAMHNIESALYSIQSEVSMMSDDVYKIAASSEKFRDDMLSESRAARYAAEALQKSTERCEWYMNRQYWKN